MKRFLDINRSQIDKFLSEYPEAWFVLIYASPLVLLGVYEIVKWIRQ